MRLKNFGGQFAKQIADPLIERKSGVFNNFRC